MNSLRWRLILGILVGVTLVLAAGGVVTYLTVKKRLYAEFDRGLHQRAVSLTSFIEQDEDLLEVKWVKRGPEPPGNQPGVDYVQVWRRNGELLATSEGLPEMSLPRFGESLDSPEFRPTWLPRERLGRAVGIMFRARVDIGKKERTARLARGETPLPEGPEIQLTLAKVDAVAPILSALRHLLVLLWAGCSLVNGLTIWFVVRKRLFPLDQLTTQIRGLRDTVAGQRILLDHQPTELAPVTHELNRLLTRIEAAIVRERNLTSNVAHELRTPIAGLLSVLEVSLSRQRPAEEYRESSQECLEIAQRMHWLVNNLLSITRMEAGNVPMRKQPILLAESLAQWWESFAARAHAKGLRVGWNMSPQAMIETDPEFLRVVLTNLFDNAVCYTPDNGTITMEGDALGSITIANGPVDLEPEMLAHIFEPFWRSSQAREEAGSHAGLGLSLCAKVIELLGGRISAHIDQEENIFVVRLELA